MEKKKGTKVGRDQTLKSGYLQMKYSFLSRISCLSRILTHTILTPPQYDSSTLHASPDIYKSAHISNPASGNSAEFVIVRKAALF